MTIFGECNPKLGLKAYGILPGRGMGYGVQFPAHQGSGPKNLWDFRGYGLWAMASMGYEGADCIEYWWLSPLRKNY